MMNLELLFEATAFSGDSAFYNIAVKHADTTMAHHFRPDNSCYHVVDYDPGNRRGKGRDKQHKDMRTNQHGLAGQAWALYGYRQLAIVILKTRSISIRHRKYITLIFTNKICRKTSFLTGIMMLLISRNEPRDASAAACTASALYELDGYLPGNHYKETADKIMESLGSPAYRAKVGTNGNFILMHSVGSILSRSGNRCSVELC